MADTATASRDAARPNVLILMADQLRGDLLGANGSTVCRTPVMDRLSAEGVGFRRAYTTVPLCSPARASLFTGRYSHAHGLTANVHRGTPTPRLPERERLLFQDLAGAGYRCGYVGKWHLNVGDEGDEARRRGVTDFIGRQEAADRHRAHLGLPAAQGGGGSEVVPGLTYERIIGAPAVNEGYHKDAAVAGESERLLRRYAAGGWGHPDRPFALVCSFFGPHFPLEVPQPYADAYHSEDVALPESFADDFAGKPQGQRAHPLLAPDPPLTRDQWRTVIARYRAYVTYVDVLMGRVLDALAALGLADRTLVLATADHGEMAGHHGLFNKGPYLYEDVLRVPLIWRWPGHVAARGVADMPASHIDVTPTLLELTTTGSRRPATAPPPTRREPGGLPDRGGAGGDARCGVRRDEHRGRRQPAG